MEILYSLVANCTGSCVETWSFLGALVTGTPCPHRHRASHALRTCWWQGVPQSDRGYLVLQVVSDTDTILPWREVRTCPRAALKPCLGGRGWGKTAGTTLMGDAYRTICWGQLRSARVDLQDFPPCWWGAWFGISTPEQLPRSFGLILLLVATEL